MIEKVYGVNYLGSSSILFWEELIFYAKQTVENIIGFGTMFKSCLRR